MGKRSGGPFGRSSICPHFRNPVLHTKSSVVCCYSHARGPSLARDRGHPPGKQRSSCRRHGWPSLGLFHQREGAENHHQRGDCFCFDYHRRTRFFLRYLRQDEGAVVARDGEVGKRRDEGLSGAALTSNKNYKYFQKFVTTAEFNRLNKWLTQDTSTFQAWKNLGLHKLDADQLKNSPALATYERYVKMYDDDVIRQLGAYKVPSMTSVGSPEEMAVKTRLWAQSNRKVDYVKKVLSLDGLSDSAMEAHKNYKYFKQFMDARKSSS